MVLFAVIALCPAAHASSDDTALTSLIALVSQRLALAEPVARLKWASQQPVNEPQRTASLLAEVNRRAKANNVDPAFAREFFQDQIEANHSLQQALFNTWRSTPPQEAPAPASSARTQAQLEQLTSPLLVSLSRLQGLRATADCPSRVAAGIANWKSLTRYDTRYTEALSQALSHVCQTGGVGAIG
ncbi:chorismate mutase [Paraburkholderia bonniea]|nr:chorismate mutase [Paraburkholderia bonniea]WJF90957.1 chorismate mutase [Paraburkholderia bonniea]WJF94271.1 chorismate mutase [Paraburkholderia bonniea]